ncbi:MAG: PD-(D/E)XK nuclease family protein [Bacteroidales bacterium]|nr:PD-(D/E)XK nuclease family protein [Bacteroidales bacterium]
MEPFLSQVARQILSEHPNDTDKVTVVFNNHRSGLFLRKYFSQQGNGSFFMPQITVIDDFIEELSGLQIVQHEFLLFELYKIHCKIGGENRKYANFQDFISFGDLMLADFSELDLYMADARQLFINLQGIKAIGEWNIEGDSLSPFQEQYLEFYRSLYQYYTSLREVLLSQGKAYSGMAYRYVAEHIDSMIDVCAGRFYYFVGFNVMSECELKIIKTLYKANLARIKTDGDSYYFDDEMQEAGLFLRKHSVDFPLDEAFESHFDVGNKMVTLVKCPENVLQCKYVGNLLDEHREWVEDSTQTAVVLADEKLLIPMLNSLPENVATVNVTMGYPYADSNVHETVLKLFSLYQHVRNCKFHHADIVEVLGDYNVAKLHGTRDLRSVMTRQLAAGNFVYASADDIGEMLGNEGFASETTSFIFRINGNVVDEFWNVCRELAARLVGCDALESNRKESEALTSMVEMADYLSSLQVENHFIESLETLQKIYTRLSRRHSISFFGQPLSGLQVLGMLETRNLDLKRVILLSANEGILPSSRSDNSLIPYDLRVAFGLPTYQQKDAVFAYHFYRLLQRAEEVWLVCSTETDVSGKGEPSRFVLQVAKELVQKFADHITLREQIVEVENVELPTAGLDEVAKSPFVMQRLAEINERGFSPSALNNYRACPMKFYYENILKIKEEKDVVEDLDQSDLGTCIHETLQQLFSADVDGRLRAETLRSELEHFDETLQQKFDKLFNSGRAIEGRNHLLYAIAKSQITNLLKLEINELEKGRVIDVIGLESKLEHSLSVNGKLVKLSGVADRIDRRGGVLCIADYKTGKVDEKDLAMDEAKFDSGKVPDKWFQVMFYALLYNRSVSSTEPMLSGVYPLRHIGHNMVPATWEGEAVIEAELLDRFEAMVKKIVSELFDVSTPFAASDDSTVCPFCPAKNVCKKSKCF